MFSTGVVSNIYCLFVHVGGVCADFLCQLHSMPLQLMVSPHCEILERFFKNSTLVEDIYKLKERYE